MPCRPLFPGIDRPPIPPAAKGSEGPSTCCRRCPCSCPRPALCRCLCLYCCDPFLPLSLPMFARRLRSLHLHLLLLLLLPLLTTSIHASLHRQLPPPRSLPLAPPTNSHALACFYATNSTKCPPVRSASSSLHLCQWAVASQGYATRHRPGHQHGPREQFEQ